MHADDSTLMMIVLLVGAGFLGSAAFKRYRKGIQPHGSMLVVVLCLVVPSFLFFDQFLLARLTAYAAIALMIWLVVETSSWLDSKKSKN